MKYLFFFISDGSKSEDVFYTREKEIKEIEGLLPEINEKITDTKDMKEETIKKLGDKRMFEEGLKSEAESTGVAPEVAAPVSEITSVANGGKCNSFILTFSYFYEQFFKD